MKREAYILMLSATIFFLVGEPLANTPSLVDQERDKPTITGQDITSSQPLTESQDRGKLLYENHCTGCHNQFIHNRNSGKVNSARDIRQWVIRWARNLNLDWEMDEITLVTDYLNEQYYHFQE